MSEDDLSAFMGQPWTMTSSDGDLPSMGVGVPHPRSYGAFARKLGHYVFQEGAVGLPAAVRSMTALPAEVMGMDDRGLLEVGRVADVVVFGPDIRDNATFTDPHQLSTGVVHLFLAGEPAMLDGEFQEARRGDVLRK